MHLDATTNIVYHNVSSPYTAVSTIEFQHAHERCYIAVLGASVDD